jgi:class 3 adenylate cyclase
MVMKKFLSLAFILLSAQVFAQDLAKSLRAPGLDYKARWAMADEELPNKADSMARKVLSDPTLMASTPHAAWAHLTLGRVAIDRQELDKASTDIAEALRLFSAAKDLGGINACNYYGGFIKELQGDLTGAVAQYRTAMSASRTLGDTLILIRTLYGLGAVSSQQANSPDQLQSLRLAVELSEKAGYCAWEVKVRVRIFQKAFGSGDTLNANAELSSAEEAMKRCSNNPDLLSRVEMAKVEMAIRQNKLSEAIRMMRALEVGFLRVENWNWASYLNSRIAKVLTEMGRPKEAIAEATKGYELSEAKGLSKPKLDNLYSLQEAYAAAGDHANAYLWFQRHEEYQEEVRSVQSIRELATIEQDLLFQKQQLADSLRFAEERFSLELQRKDAEDTRNLILLSGIGVLLLSFGLWNRLRYTREASAVLHKEKERSEELLLNILPLEVAEELKSKGQAEARLMEHVTVLFTDFKGFTQMSELVTPKELVKDLHECFSAFDRICEKYGIEKIKTIGDAYMAAGGLPTPCYDHAERAVSAALEMAAFVSDGKARRQALGQPFFEIRIGIHTGPVVAGIVGVKKFQYDIWGDTVNTASRMESSGEVGLVNISEATYQLVKDHFHCEYRGEIEAKGKGRMGMWFVIGDTI